MNFLTLTLRRISYVEYMDKVQNSGYDLLLSKAFNNQLTVTEI